MEANTSLFYLSYYTFLLKIFKEKVFYFYLYLCFYRESDDENITGIIRYDLEDNTI